MIKLPKMHVISCAKTVDAVIERRKTVTRRWGWKHARVGMFLRVVDRLRYRDTDPPQVTLACVEVVKVTRQDDIGAGGAFDIAFRSLELFRFQHDPYAQDECWREGFRSLESDNMVLASLLASMAPKDYRERGLTRIEWVYREDLFEAWKEQR